MYDKNNPKHFNRNPEKDVRDGKFYVTDSVDWFVEKVSIQTEKVTAFLMVRAGNAGVHRST